MPTSSAINLMWPVAYKPKLTGGFGEFRTIRFHHGLDISTGGTTGHKVYAAAGGYVSSVLYHHYGAGYGLFVTHPGGYKTFYCHLKKFSWYLRKHHKIRKYRSHMMNKKNFNIKLRAGDIPVRRGTIIAYSGDTGAVPPHLHFELRRGSDLTVNPLINGIRIRDRRAPIIRGVHLMPLSHVSQSENNEMGTIIKAKRYRGRYYILKQKKIPQAYGLIGIKIDAYDPWVHYKLPIFGMKLYIDNKLVFQRQLKSIYRSKSYKAGTIYDFDYSSSRKFIYYLYSRNTKKGALKITKKNNIRRIKIMVYDARGNRSYINFKIKSGESQKGLSPKKLNLFKGQRLVLKSSDNKCTVQYSKKAALYNEEVHLTKDPQPTLYLKGFSSRSDQYTLSPSHLCVLKRPKLSLKYTGSDRKKVGIYIMSGNAFYFQSNRYDKKSKSFIARPIRTSTFFLARDDTKPTAYFKNKRRYRRPSRILIRVRDSGSGLNIKRCIVQVDNKKVYWVQDILWKKSYIEIFKHNKVWSRGKHIISLYLVDNAGNNRSYRYIYYRY